MNKTIYLVAGGIIVAGVVLINLLTKTPPHQSLASPSVVAVSSEYKLADVTKHASVRDCWTAINDKVYNITDYIPNHPGGSRIIQACGKDATNLFTGRSAIGRMHSQIAQQILTEYKVGNLAN